MDREPTAEDVAPTRARSSTPPPRFPPRHPYLGNDTLNRSTSVSVKHAAISIIDPEQEAAAAAQPQSAEAQPEPAPLVDEKQSKKQKQKQPHQQQQHRFLRVGRRVVMNIHESSCLVFSGENAFRNLCFDLIDHWLFDIALIVVILFNVAYYVVDTTGTATDFVTYSEYVVQGLYTVEMLIKIVALGFIAHPYSYCRDPLRFAELLIVLSGFAAIPLVPLSQRWATLRTLKLIRLFRVLERVMQHVAALRGIFDALVGGLPRFADIALFVAFLVCALSIIGVQLFRGKFNQRCYFEPPTPAAAALLGNATTVETVYNETYRNQRFSGTVTRNWQGLALANAPLLDPLEPWPCSTEPAAGGYECARGAVCAKNASIYESIYANFDHLGTAAFVVLKITSVDSIQDEIRRMQYTLGSASVLFGLVIVFLVSFCAINFFIAVMSWEYDVACMRHLPDVKEQLRLNPDALPPWADDPPPSDAFFDVETPLLGAARKFLFRWTVGTPQWFWLSVLVVAGNVGILAGYYDKMPADLVFIFDWVNISCGCFYILEESVKLFCLFPSRYFAAKLNVFNLLLAAVVLAELIMMLLEVENGREIFTALHAVYMLRLFSLAVKFESARQLLLTVAGAAKSSFMLFLVLLTYVAIAAIFAVFLFEDALVDGRQQLFQQQQRSSNFTLNGTSLATSSDDGKPPRPNFSNLPQAILALLIVLSGESWVTITTDVMRGAGGGAAVFFYIFFFVGTYLLLNLFVVIVISSYRHTAEQIAAWKAHERRKRRALLRGTSREEDGEDDNIYIDEEGKSDDDDEQKQQQQKALEAAPAAVAAVGARRVSGGADDPEDEHGFGSPDAVAAAAMRAVDENNQQAEQERQQKQQQQQQSLGTQPPTPTDADPNNGSDASLQQQNAAGSVDSSGFVPAGSDDSRRGSAVVIPKLDLKVARWKATAADARDKQHKEEEHLRRQQDQQQQQHDSKKRRASSTGSAGSKASTSSRPRAPSTRPRSRSRDSPAGNGQQQLESSTAGTTSVPVDGAPSSPQPLSATQINNNNTAHGAAGGADSGSSPAASSRVSPGSSTRKVREKQRKTLAMRVAALLGTEYLTFDSVASNLEGTSFFLFSRDNCFRQYCAYVASHPFFEFFTLIVVLESLLVLGFEAGIETKLQTLQSTAELVAQPILVNNIIISGWFVLEMLLKMVAFQCCWRSRKDDGGLGQDDNKGGAGAAAVTTPRIAALALREERTYFSESWNQFDFVVVVVTVLSMFVEVNFLKALRIFRLAAKFANQRVVLQSILRAIPGILKVVVLVLAYIFLAAVLGVQLFKGRYAACNDASITNRSQCVGEYRVDRIKYTQNRSNNMEMSVYNLSAMVPRRWSSTFYNFDNTANGLVAGFLLFWNEGWVQVMFDTMDGGGDPDTGRGFNEWSTVPVIYFVAFMMLGNFFLHNLFIGLLLDLFKRQHKFELGFSDKQGNSLLTDEQEAWVRNFKFAQAAALPNPPPRAMTRFRKLCCWLYFEDARMEEVSRVWEVAVTFCVLVNVAFMATEFEGMSDFWVSFLWYENLILTVFFAIEVVVGCVALTPLLFAEDPNNIFNLLVTVASFISIGLSGPGINVLRVARIFRVLQVVKQARGVYKLWSALVYAAPQVVNVTVLVALLLYVFGITATALFGNAYIDPEDPNEAFSVYYNFQNPGMSMLTLAQIATTDNFAKVMEKIAGMTEDNSGCRVADDSCGKWYALPFCILFLLCAHSIALNLYIFVIVDNVLELNELNDVRTQWMLTQIGDFRRLWLSFDKGRRKKIRWQYLVLLIRHLLVMERASLKRFRREIGIPIKVFRTTDGAETLIVESLVNERSADKHSASGLELQLRAFYKRQHRKERRRRREALEEQVREEEEEAAARRERGGGSSDDEAGSGRNNFLSRRQPQQMRRRSPPQPGGRSPLGAALTESAAAAASSGARGHGKRRQSAAKIALQEMSSSSSDSDFYDDAASGSDEAASSSDDDRAAASPPPLQRTQSQLKRVRLRRKSSSVSAESAAAAAAASASAASSSSASAAPSDKRGGGGNVNAPTSFTAFADKDIDKQDHLHRKMSMKTLALSVIATSETPEKSDASASSGARQQQQQQQQKQQQQQPRARAVDEDMWCVNEKFLLARLEALAIPIMPGGLVDFGDCVFGLTRAYSGSTGELSGYAKMFLAKVREIDYSQTFQLHHAVAAMRILRWLRNCHARRARRLEMAAMDFMLMASEQQQRMDDSALLGETTATTSSEDTASAAADQLTQLIEQMQRTGALDQLRRMFSKRGGATSSSSAFTSAPSAAAAAARGSPNRADGRPASQSPDRSRSGSRGTAAFDGAQQQQLLQQRRTTIGDVLTGRHRRLSTTHGTEESGDSPSKDVGGSSATFPSQVIVPGASADRDAILRNFLAFDDAGAAAAAAAASDPHSLLAALAAAQHDNEAGKADTADSSVGTDPLPHHLRAALGQTIAQEASRTAADALRARNAAERADRERQREAARREAEAAALGGGGAAAVAAALRKARAVSDAVAAEPQSEQSAAVDGSLARGDDPYERYGIDPLVLPSKMPAGKYEYYAAPATGRASAPSSRANTPQRRTSPDRGGDTAAAAPAAGAPAAAAAADGEDVVTGRNRRRLALGMPKLEHKPVPAPGDYRYRVGHLFPPGHPQAKRERLDDQEELRQKRRRDEKAKLLLLQQQHHQAKRGVSPTDSMEGGERASADRTAAAPTGAASARDAPLTNDDEATADTVTFTEELVPPRPVLPTRTAAAAPVAATGAAAAARPFSLSSPLPLQLARCTKKFDASQSAPSDERPFAAAQVIAAQPGQLFNVLDVLVSGSGACWAFVSRVSKPDDKGVLPLECLQDAVSGAAVVSSASSAAARQQSNSRAASFPAQQEQQRRPIADPSSYATALRRTANQQRKDPLDDDFLVDDLRGAHQQQQQQQHQPTSVSAATARPRLPISQLLYEFTSEHECEMSCAAGEVVEILSDPNATLGWTRVMRLSSSSNQQQASGLVPTNYLQALSVERDRSPPPRVVSPPPRGLRHDTPTRAAPQLPSTAAAAAAAGAPPAAAAAVAAFAFSPPAFLASFTQHHSPPEPLAARNLEFSDPRQSSSTAAAPTPAAFKDSGASALQQELSARIRRVQQLERQDDEGAAEKQRQRESAAAKLDELRRRLGKKN